jgi:hypothetical protein
VITDEIGLEGFTFVRGIIFRRSRFIIDGRKQIPKSVKFRNSGKFKETT